MEYFYSTAATVDNLFFARMTSEIGPVSVLILMQR
jgi:hypothetical protein